MRSFREAVVSGFLGCGGNRRCSNTRAEPTIINALDVGDDAKEENVANTFQRLLPSTAYASLTRDGVLVKIAQYGRETWYSQPKDYFAHGGTHATCGGSKISVTLKGRPALFARRSGQELAGLAAYE